MNVDYFYKRKCIPFSHFLAVCVAIYSVQWGLAKYFFYIKGQRLHILEYGDHMVTVTTTFLCQSAKIAVDNTSVHEHRGIPAKRYS